MTIAIIQLVASKRGVAALPFWAVKPYLERGYVVSQKELQNENCIVIYMQQFEKQIKIPPSLRIFYETVKSQKFFYFTWFVRIVVTKL